MSDALRLAFGTLTIVPTRPPSRVDRTVGSWAMTLAPLVGGVLGVLAGAALWLMHEVIGQGDRAPYLTAALTIGLLTVLTRAIHLDGLADTADGLGSGQAREPALAIMHRSDIGPFGVATLVLVLLVQVTALGQLIAAGSGVYAVAVAAVVSRLAVPLVCSRGIGAARADGLGQVVAGSVSLTQLLLAFAGSLALLGLLAVVAASGPLGLSGLGAGWLAALALTALPVGGVLCWVCVRRFGGTTGDVIGACVEAVFTSALVLLAYA